MTENEKAPEPGANQSGQLPPLGSNQSADSSSPMKNSDNQSNENNKFPKIENNPNTTGEQSKDESNKSPADQKKEESSKLPEIQNYELNGQKKGQFHSQNIPETISLPITPTFKKQLQLDQQTTAELSRSDHDLSHSQPQIHGNQAQDISFLSRFYNSPKNHSINDIKGDIPRPIVPIVNQTNILNDQPNSHSNRTTNAVTLNSNTRPNNNSNVQSSTSSHITNNENVASTMPVESPVPIIQMSTGKKHRHHHHHRSRSSKHQQNNTEDVENQSFSQTTTNRRSSRNEFGTVTANQILGKSELLVTPEDLRELIQNEESEVDSEETIDALQTFKKSGKLPMSSTKPQVIRKLQREKVNSILQGNYDNAKEADELSKKVAVSVFMVAEEDRRNERLQRELFRLEDEKASFSEYKKDCQAKLAEEIEALNQRKQALEDIHAEELRNLEEKWNNDDFLRRYSKPSTHLLQLKAIERSMVIAKMFDDAKTVRGRAEQLEKSETKDAQTRAEREMVIERQRLRDKQARETEHLKLKCDQLLNIVKKNLENGERPFRKRIEKLETIIAELKNGGNNDQKDKEKVVPSMVLTTPRGSGNELLTARTAFKLSAYKAASQSMKLKIKPLGNITGTSKKGK
ncbi:hypothetical protein TRFO_14003 [Tritrichomonas foetus]|uniref:Uncharacterized protein n=1 Tax=Tritrichomonas foetus TaxID=1144522 RepID=A0A1J4KWL0_9EUKA|nr:hypothetical protein TRFO_14003 [Tritrichomonas foetus]|eukprot:OHT15635.1 hypothetical protein TRFO_14003 [Tritrichomonas foetus]